VSDRELTLSVEITVAAFILALLALAEWERLMNWLRRRNRTRADG